MANKTNFADQMRTTFPDPDDWGGWVEVWCREDTGNIDCVPECLRPYVEDCVTPEGWLKYPDMIPNTPYKVARFCSPMKFKPPWFGTGIFPDRAKEIWLEHVAKRAAEAELNMPADLYFIGGQVGPIKIGVSAEPGKRLRQLQTGYPYKLQLLAVVRGAALQEGDYHARFAAHRLEGEWFDRHPDILSEIERQAAA